MLAALPTGKRVLLIDDDFLLREMVTLTLAGDGYMIATAANGDDAFERLRQFERPNLILLDLTMPRMDGLHFRRRQQEDTQLASIPVVVCSAAGDIEQQASSLGARAYLQKPVDTGCLLDTVRRCCG
jgi:twitching motility two-component system response regulator PilH